LPVANKYAANHSNGDFVSFISLLLVFTAPIPDWIRLSLQFPNPNDYSAFMGDFSSCTGLVTFGMMLLSRVIFRKFGWGVAAQITPIVLLITGVAFFGLLLFGGPIAPWLASVGMTPLLAAVYVGALQNIFSKSAKYSLFDPCKEMAYIPLDEETKVGLKRMM
jgi:AAA family ATP:ADP antiporter